MKSYDLTSHAKSRIWRWVSLRCLFCIMVLTCPVKWWSFSFAQSENYIDDKGSGTVNHNYFAAKQNPELARLLQSVETNHLLRTPAKPNGVMGWIQEGNYGYALNELRYTLDRFVNHPMALSMLNLVAKLQGTPALPLPYYEKAIGLYPNYAVTHVQYGLYLTDIGEYGKAIYRLKESLKVGPDSAVAYSQLARCYRKIGETGLAEEAETRARELGHK
jgi:tetratricopeptide (TPR) repeat protein